MEPIILAGGVDLKSPPTISKPGTLRSCLNYEAATNGGYSRIAGVERVDGGPGVNEIKIARVATPSVIGAFSAGDRIELTVDGPATYVGYVTYVSPDGDYISAIFEGGSYTLYGGGDILCPDTLAEAIAGEVIILSQPDGTQDVVDAALDALAATRRASVLQVPGRSGSDVIATFMFRNDTYAVRDLPVVFFEGGYYTDANEGHAIEIDGEKHIILDAQPTGHQSGFIVYDPSVSPSATLATPIGSPTLSELPISGSLDGGYTSIPYSDSLSVSGGLPPYTWVAIDGDEPPAAPSFNEDLSEIDFLVEQTPAALWRADEDQWTMVGMRRELSFRSGTSNLKNFSRSTELITSDVKDSGAAYPTNSEIDSVTSTGPNANDGTFAVLAATSGTSLHCKGFSLSALPSGAQVVGIKVEIERSAGAANNTTDAAVVLTGIPGRGENKAGGSWPTSQTIATYGGSSDTWGIEGLTTDDLKDANFGVLLVAKRVSSGTPMNSPSVDFVRVTVYYVDRAGIPIYFWNGSTDVSATLVHAQATNGDATINTLSGFMTIDCSTNADKSRLISEGDQIRTASGGGGDLLAVAASRDRNIFLPGQTDIDHNQSRYVFRQANFFGQDDYDSVYGVSGAGPAFSFDGTSIIKIRTPLNPKDDVPRHIAKHGNSLVLGYFGGAALLTAPGNPFETRGDQGATAIEIGDRLVGFAEMAGDALGIICKERTELLRGLSQATYYKSVISPRRGGLEYTLADMGRVILSDSFGLFAADTPESFAAAERNYLSENVEPWLSQRLQALLDSEQRYMRPIASLAVRSKNQYRMFFSDGWILTMTVRESMEFTMQRLYTPGSGALSSDVPWAVRALASGIDASGRERLLCSFKGIKQGYLFELDVGNTMDGAEIPHHIELNPIAFGGMANLSRIDKIVVGGVGNGHAMLKMSRGKNNEGVDESIYADVEFGTSDAPATVTPVPIRGTVDFPLEGYEFSIRFHAVSGQDRPHSLQIMWVDGDQRGTTRGHRTDR